MDRDLESHCDRRIVLVALGRLRAAHGDHAAHHFAEAQSRPGEQYCLADICPTRRVETVRWVSADRLIDLHHNGLLNSSRMNGKTSRLEYWPRNTSRCP